MKLNRITIHNLYSYIDETVELGEYNVVVGPNGSGKTNLARILSMVYKNFQSVNKQQPYLPSLTTLYIDEYQRNKSDQDSYLLLNIELDEREAELFKKTLLVELTPAFKDYKKLLQTIRNDNLKKIDLLLWWKETDPIQIKTYGIRPEIIIIRLNNGQTFIIQDLTVKLTYTNDVLDYVKKCTTHFFTLDYLKTKFNNNKTKTISINLNDESNIKEFYKWIFNIRDNKAEIKIKRGKSQIEVFIDPRPYLTINISDKYIAVDEFTIQYNLIKQNNTQKIIFNVEIPLSKRLDYINSYINKMNLSLISQENSVLQKLFNCRDTCTYSSTLLVNDIPEDSYLLLDVSRSEIEFGKNNLVDELLKVELAEFFNKRKNPLINLPFPTLFSSLHYLYFLLLTIFIIPQERPRINELADLLFTLKNRVEYVEIYKKIEEKFKKYSDVEVTVVEVEDNTPTKIIYIKEGEKYIKLEDSANGYKELLSLLMYFEIAKQQSVIVLDEPATNLHPTKMKVITEELKELCEKGHTQIILITHSPYFVGSDNSRLLYIKKGSNGSKVKSSTISIKKHILNPSIFFARCAILVEGSSDIEVLDAISNKFNEVNLANHDVTLISCYGKDNIYNYIEVCKDFDIKYIAMIDDDYLFRWGKIEEDKCRLLIELHDDKTKDKLEKDGIKLNGFNIKNKDKIEIQTPTNDNKEIILKDKCTNEEVRFRLEENAAYIIKDNKKSQLSIEKGEEDNKEVIYVYRDKNLSLGNKRKDTNIVILEGALEDELRRIIAGTSLESDQEFKNIWDPYTRKLTPEIANKVMDKILENTHEERIKDSKFYKEILKKACDLSK